MTALFVWIAISIIVVGLWILACEFTGWRRGNAMWSQYDAPAEVEVMQTEQRWQDVAPLTAEVTLLSDRTDTQEIRIVRPAAV